MGRVVFMDCGSDMFLNVVLNSFVVLMGTQKFSLNFMHFRRGFIVVDFRVYELRLAVGIGGLLGLRMGGSATFIFGVFGVSALVAG